MRSHTVILGAGATIAAIPNGDRNGKYSSVMNGLFENLGLSSLLDGIDLNTKSRNIEDIYSELSTKHEYKDVVQQLEKHLYDYFASLELPEEPTIYDLLILSLTKNDVIATFNWDPLLIQAYVRCHEITDNLPHIFCLHGNVAVGYCNAHKEFGVNDTVCPECGDKLRPLNLLYPIANKEYNSNDYIKGCWEATQYILENSYMLTIFGYSAPKSDIAAMNLLRNAWGSPYSRQLEEVSIIDILEEDEVTMKWSDFIYSHHYRYSKDFFSSYLGMFPRRSCETVFATKQLNFPPESNMGFRDGMTWCEIEEFLNNILFEETQTIDGKNYPLYYVKKIGINNIN